MSQPTEFRYQAVQSDQPSESVRIEPGDKDQSYSVTIGGHTYTVFVDQVTPDSIRFFVEGRSRRAYVVRDGSRRLVAFDGIDGHVYALTPASESPDMRGARRKATAKAGAEGRIELTATMPGQVVKVLVNQGEAVTRGQPLVVLEAMKMELRVTAPQEGQVARVSCEPGQVVERGQVLLELSGA